MGYCISLYNIELAKHELLIPPPPHIFFVMCCMYSFCIYDVQRHLVARAANGQ